MPGVSATDHGDQGDQGDHGDHGHYFSSEPDASSAPASVDLVLPDLHLTLRTDRGVFSGTRVDPGTKLLLLELPPPSEWPEGPVVDVGAGYGPIACAAAVRAPDRRIWAVEVNARAADLCRVNAAAHELDVHTVAPDDVPDSLRPGLIVSNPPIRVGKAALHELLETWMGRLLPGGEAWLVVQRNLGADSLASWMESRSWQVARTRSRQGYRILRVTH